MWSLARKNLLKERMRLLISLGGVAFSVMLIVLIRGLFVAYQTKVEDFIQAIGADLWVVQSGTADQFHSFSILPTELREAVAGVDGVEAVRPRLSRQVGFTLEGKDTLLYVSGFDPIDPVTGPVRMVEGTMDVAADGIVVDRVFARKNSVGVGNRLTLGGVELEIVGISAGGDMVMYQYAFVSLNTARLVLEMTALDNAFLLDLVPGASPEAVAAGVEALSPLLDVRTTSQIISENQRVINDGFLPVIAVLLSIGFLVGVAVIGLTIYSAVLEKRREYGMLKAIGAGAGQIAGVVFVQALLAAGLGYLGGVVLGFAAGRAAARWVPEFVTKIVPSDLAWVAAATVLMALLASLLPLWRIARIDPAEVFRA